MPPMNWILAGAIATVVIAVGCSSAPRNAGATRCQLTASDSVYLADGPVYRDCAVDRKAKISGRRNVDFTSAHVPTLGRRCYTVEVEFVVWPAGVPEAETARIVSSNDKVLERAVLASFPSWRYQPARREGMPVRQIVKERLALMAVAVAVRTTSPTQGLPTGSSATRRPITQSSCS